MVFYLQPVFFCCCFFNLLLSLFLNAVWRPSYSFILHNVVSFCQFKKWMKASLWNQVFYDCWQNKSVHFLILMVDKLHILIDKMHYLPYTEKHKKTCFIRCHAAVWFLICFTALTLRISSEGHFNIRNPTGGQCFGTFTVQRYSTAILCYR